MPSIDPTSDPDSDSEATQTEHRRDWKASHWFLMWSAVCAAVSLAGNVSLPWVLKTFLTIPYVPYSTPPSVLAELDIYDEACAVALGGFLSQFAAIAAWAALSRWPLPYRILTCLSGSLFATISLIVGSSWMDGEDIPLAAYLFLACGGIAIGLTTAWFLTHGFRRRKAYIPAEISGQQPSNTSKGSQFGIKFLLALMATTAMSIQFVRATLPNNLEAWMNGGEYIFIVLWFLWLILGISVLIWLQCLVFLEHRRRRWMVVGWLLCMALGPLVFQIVSIYAIFGSASRFYMTLQIDLSYELIVFAYCIMLGMVAGLATALLGARWIGYRLESSSAAPPNEAFQDSNAPAATVHIANPEDT